MDAVLRPDLGLQGDRRHAVAVHRQRHLLGDDAADLGPDDEGGADGDRLLRVPGDGQAGAGRPAVIAEGVGQAEEGVAYRLAAAGELPADQPGDQQGHGDEGVQVAAADEAVEVATLGGGEGAADGLAAHRPALRGGLLGVVEGGVALLDAQGQRQVVGGLAQGPHQQAVDQAGGGAEQADQEGGPLQRPEAADDVEGHRQVEQGGRRQEQPAGAAQGGGDAHPAAQGGQPAAQGGPVRGFRACGHGRHSRCPPLAGASGRAARRAAFE